MNYLLFSINYYLFSKIVEYTSQNIFVAFEEATLRGHQTRGGSIKRQHHNRKTITLADPDYQSNWHIRAKRVNDALV